MADVTTTFAAKDVGFAATLQRMQAQLVGFQKSINGISASAKNIGGSFRGMTRSVIGLGAAYLGASQAIQTFNKALGMADRLDDLSKITGASAGDLAVLERAFQNTGVGGDRMLPMLSKMTQFVENLGKGNKDAVATANMLGVSFDQLNRLAPIDRFKLLMRAIMGLTSENKQNSAAMDVFGTRAGLVATLLAKNFNGSLSEARGQLGSLVDILNKSGQTLGELNDTLKNSVFNKPTEFAIGFLAGIQGANDFAAALANIDAAGFGQKIGKMFAGIAKDPGSGFLLFGEMLLLAVKNAGNALINATIFAADVYKAALTNPSTFGAMADGLLAGFQMVFNFAARMVQTIVKTMIEGVAGIASLIPGIGKALAADISKPIAGIEALQDTANKQADALRERMMGAMGKTGADILQKASTMPRPNEDFLGAANQRTQVDTLANRLNQIGVAKAATQEASAQQPLKSATELQTIYNDQMQKLRESGLSVGEFGKRVKELNDQFYQALQQNMTPPVQQARDAAMSQPARNAAIKDANEASDDPLEEVASETTLQKVAKFLEELNGKLPQPVLV